MALLDAFLACALTLAALATVVSILLEIVTRVAGLKARRQVEFFSLFFDEVVRKQLPAGASGWEVVKAVLESRLSNKKMAENREAQHYFGTAAGAIYGDVSLEHVLRRFLETRAAASLLAESEEMLKTRLGHIARKYEEYCSALGADFKRNALRRSVWIGIVLAFAMNADGVRLLATYLQDPDLRGRVIEKLESPPELPVVDGAQTVADETIQAVQAAQRQLALLDDLALPMGAGYFPYCHVSWLRSEVDHSADPLCEATDKIPPGAWVLWFLKVLVTGILIGLGAPFWYDVARRLAAVRSAFQGKGAAEEAHRGADAAGSPNAREMLVATIVADVKAAARAGL
ncbi:MAG: hypothetical protein ACFCUT_18585 [Kiloniellaceae bacterium]